MLRPARFIAPILTIAIAISATASTAAAKGKKPLEDPGAGDDQSEPTGPGGGAAHGPFGLGIVLGDPTGFTGKLLFAQYHGVQLHVGWYTYSNDRRGHFILAADYLFHFVNAIPPIERAGRLVPYVGIGGRLGVRDSDALLAVRFPGGLAFFLNAAPLEFFVEIALGIGIVPETIAILDGVIGGRWYF